jgi:predicted short-subunit dehydrogenase-like oxidoreductase (DUF2520 family)
MIQYKISFAGAGKVASALCRELFNNGYLIQNITSRNPKNGREIADLYKAVWSSKLVFPDSADIIIVAVPDHILKDIIHKIKCRKDTIIVHTAGSLGLEVFPSYFENAGILYPLQTFSINRIVDFKKIPFFIEASNDTAGITLKSLAETISDSVHFTDSETRRMLHLAAVFVSNFSNHMFTAGKEISEKAGFNFEALKPLIKETVFKALELGPENSQTGPALRNDLNTMEKHMELLSFSPELTDIYRTISKSIINYYKTNKQDGEL